MQEPDYNELDPCQDSGDEQYRVGDFGTHGQRKRLTEPKKSLNKTRKERAAKKIARKKQRKQ